MEVPICEEVETPDTIYDFLPKFPWILRKCEASKAFLSLKLMEHWPGFLELDNLKR